MRYAAISENMMMDMDTGDIHFTIGGDFDQFDDDDENKD